jgi:hypothetical protein
MIAILGMALAPCEMPPAARPAGPEQSSDQLEECKHPHSHLIASLGGRMTGCMAELHSDGLAMLRWHVLMVCH